MTHFKEILQDYQNWFNLELQTEFSNCFKNLQPALIFEAVQYAMLNGGKRIRPTLLLKTADLYGVPREKIKQFAFSIEMLHTYSLVHDDLPALDNDDYRRGRLTVHKKFDESTAVLTGDALLTMAFEYLVLPNNYVSSDSVVKSVRLLADLSGANGMIGGQVADIMSEKKDPDYETIKFIHEKKTVALLSAAVQIGAVLGNASDEEQKYLYDFSVAFGHAFQISDDILNVTGDEKQMGKKTGTDLEKGKMTYISLFGLDKTKQLCSDYVLKGKESLNDIKNKDMTFFNEIIDYLLHRER